MTRVENDGCRFAPPNVELVVARYSENVAWALDIVERAPAGSLSLTVWNHGEPIPGLPSGVERRVPNRGREALPYLEHMIQAAERAVRCGET